MSAFGRANEASAAVEYVRICSQYGAGFFFIPGTDTCIKVGGYLRADAAGTYVEQPVPSNMSGYRIPGYDARQQSCYGTLSTFGRVAALPQSNNCLLLNPGGTYQVFAPRQQPEIDKAYITFAGIHIGANGGWMGSSRDVSATELFNGDAFFTAPFGTRNVGGGFGGAQAGYDWQRGNWVYGVEADVQGGSIHGTSRATFEPYVGPGTFIRFHTDECISAFGTARVRVGYAVNNFLLYGTVGIAAAETNIRIGERDSLGWDARLTDSTVRVGVAAGAGIEYKVSQHLSLKAEYLYLNLGDAAVKAREFNGAIPTATEIWTSNRLDFNIVRVGANWQFDGGGTSVSLRPQ